MHHFSNSKRLHEFKVESVFEQSTTNCRGNRLRYRRSTMIYHRLETGARPPLISQCNFRNSSSDYLALTVISPGDQFYALARLSQWERSVINSPMGYGIIYFPRGNSQTSANETEWTNHFARRLR